MSWLARSITNSLRLEEDEDGPDKEDTDLYDAVFPVDLQRDSTLSAGPRRSSGDGDDHSICGEDEEIDGDGNRRGVKEDLSELKDSLARQLWGVASFLAPPPPPPPPPLLTRRSGYEYHESEKMGKHEGEPGQFLLPQDYYKNIAEDAIGITEEVLAFARDIAHHPETWLDFPLSEEEEFDDFDISDAQYKHALAVEHLAPRLAALRIELCPVHMTVGYFWMVYFVLLHSRLNKRDADLLSTSQLAQARNVWMHELEKNTKKMELSGAVICAESPDLMHHSFIMHCDEAEVRSGHISEPQNIVGKQLVDEIEFVDKPVINECLSPELREKEMIVSSVVAQDAAADDDDDDGDDDDDWLKDVSDFIGYSDKTVVGNEEDISFSDLEDDFDRKMAA